MGLFLPKNHVLEYIPLDMNALRGLAFKIGELRFKEMVEAQLGIVDQQLNGINPFNGELLPTHTERQRKGILNAKTLYERILSN